LPLSGGVPIQLTEPVLAGQPRYVSNFQIAPDSAHVVFQDALFDTAPGFTNPYVDLFVVSIFGGPITQLCAAQSYCLAYHIAPDSSCVLFTADVDVALQFELYSVPLAGGAAQKLNPQLGGGSVGTVTWCPYPSCSGAPPSFSDTWARFSPASARVVFTASASASSLRALYSVPSAGGPATLLASSPTGAGIADAFSTSADSTRVVYLAPSPAGGNALYSVPTAGGAPTLLSGALVAGGTVSAHAESPDSGTVVFVADKDTDDQFELYRVPIGGGTIAKLGSTLPAAGDVSGTGLAVTADSRAVVFLADVDANGQQELLRASLRGPAPVRRLSGTLVSGGYLQSWLLAGDASTVVYRADQDHDETFELYASPLTRAPRRR
jgi:Tol biopolymer transport system component